MQEALNHVVDDTFNRWLVMAPSCHESINRMRNITKENLKSEVLHDFALDSLWYFKDIVEY